MRRKPGDHRPLVEALVVNCAILGRDERLLQVTLKHVRTADPKPDPYGYYRAWNRVVKYHVEGDQKRERAQLEIMREYAPDIAAAFAHLAAREGASLSRAARRGELEGVRLLLKAGCPVDGAGVPPLCDAVARGSEPITAELIKRGADVNATWTARSSIGFTGMTPLITMGRRPEVIRLLIRHGGDVNAIDKERNTPLSMAANAGCAECVRALLKGGANPNFLAGKDRRPAAWGAQGIETQKLLTSVTDPALLKD